MVILPVDDGVEPLVLTRDGLETGVETGVVETGVVETGVMETGVVVHSSGVGPPMIRRGHVIHHQQTCTTQQQVVPTITQLS